MKNKLDCILLIDDDKDCNFLHSRAIKKLNCANSIKVAKNCGLALEFLRNTDKFPELIFLDINIPQMNAWEFLGEYQKFEGSIIDGTVLIILTSSMNPDDKVRAASYEEVKGFHIKYLNKDSLTGILQKHFPDNF